MKPFNLEEYLADPTQKVITRNGQAVEIISTNGREQFPIIGYVGNNQLPASWRSDGRFMKDGETINPFDLFFADEESEDERIRKELVAFFIEVRDREGLEAYWHELKVADILKWFIKQKEQKPAEDSTRAKIISRATSEKQVVLLSESNGSAEIGWDTRSLEDAKNLLEYGLIFVNERLGIKPAEWSEEDKRILDEAIGMIEARGCWVRSDDAVKQVSNFLKSLRPGPHWKPSKKQMKKLLSIIGELRDMGHNDIADFLASLYGQLKKLMEE